MKKYFHFLKKVSMTIVNLMGDAYATTCWKFEFHVNIVLIWCVWKKWALDILIFYHAVFYHKGF